MAVAHIERVLVDELQTLLCNPKFTKKDLLEWSTAPILPALGEIAVEVQALDMTWYCCVPASADKRKKKGA